MMKVECTELEDSKVKIHYEADTSVVASKINEAVLELKKLPIPGFRAGKAPDHIIKVKCKPQINKWVVREMASQAYDDALFETKIKPIGQPKFSNVIMENKNFSIDIEVLKKPSFDLKEYKEFEIPRPHINRNITEATQAGLQELRLQKGDVVPYTENDSVEMGDTITMDCSSEMDGESLSNEEGVVYLVGSNKYEGFDKEILGMLPDEERSFELSFNDKKVTFKVRVHMGMKKTPHPLDDELAKKFNFNSLQELKTRLELISKSNIEKNESNLIREQIVNRLLDNHDFTPPAILVTMEAEFLASKNGFDFSSLSDDEKEIILTQAAKGVKLSLILDSIREAEPDSVLTNDEAFGSLKKTIEMQGADSQQFLEKAKKSGQLLGMIEGLRSEYTLQWVADSVKLID